MHRSSTRNQLTLFDTHPAGLGTRRAPDELRPEPSSPELNLTRPYAAAPLPVSLLRECPASEKPRERLLTAGAASLSETELVAVLIDVSSNGVSPLDQARELLHRHRGLPALPSLGPQVLASSGLTTAQVAQLLAACELACRLSREAVAERPAMTRPADLASYLSLRFGRRDQEVLGAVLLDSRLRLLGVEELYRGTLARISVEPREVFKLAILAGAASVVLFHTHPSGDPSPSAEDLDFTRRFHQAGEVVGVRLTDHLILGGAGRWCSLKERGTW